MGNAGSGGGYVEYAGKVRADVEPFANDVEASLNCCESWNSAVAVNLKSSCR